LTELLILAATAACLVRSCQAQASDPGRVVAVLSYVLTLTIGLGNVPLLVQQSVRLRDISCRLGASEIRPGEGAPLPLGRSELQSRLAVNANQRTPTWASPDSGRKLATTAELAGVTPSSGQ